ncbi:MAG: hypothetical protein ACI88A_004129 [Paraglaciecola sp.]|jgi:hypothetical protein
MSQCYENFNAQAWNTTQVFADGMVNSTLFPKPVRPSDIVLLSIHKKLKNLIETNKLTQSNVTINEQRVLPWVLLPCLKGNFTGLLSISDAWAQIVRLLTEKTPFDPVTLEALAYEWDERTPTHLSSAQLISTQIEKMLNISKSARSQRTLNNLTISADVKGNAVSWAESIILRGRQKFEKIYHSFEILSLQYHQDKNLDEDIHKARSKFWRCYFAQGLVKNCWLACDPETKRGYLKDTNNVLAFTQFDETQFAIIFQLGDSIVVEWMKPVDFCLHKTSARLQLSLSADTININELYGGIISKYKFNSMGYWQYLIASTLKKQTQFMPTRASYL